MLCKKSPHYFIFKYCLSLDPVDNKIKVIPDFKYLRDFITELDSDQDDLIEKSRQMIISWTTCAYQLWRFIFKTNSSSFNVSRKEDFVDDKTIASVLGKIDFMYNRLPSFLKPAIKRTYLKMYCPARESFITGESANENAGRGGSFDLVFVDEAGFIPRGETVFASLKQACKRKFVLVSTPNGKANFFARIRFNVETQFKIISLSWKLHPERNQAWYDNQIKDMTKLQIARELDLSYEDSLAGRVFSFNSVNNTEKFNEEYIRKIIKGKTVYAGIDFGFSDPTAIVFMVFDGDRAIIFDEYQDNLKTPQVHTIEIKKILDKWKIKSLVTYGDPSGGNRSQSTGRSLFKDYQDNGLHIIAGNNEVQAGIRRIELGLTNKKLFIMDNCPKMIDALSESTFPVDRNGRTTKETYIHDEHSHPLDALRYVYLSANPIVRDPKTLILSEPEETNPYTGY